MTDIVIRPLQADDKADWRRLWTAYLEFYKATVPEAVYATTWRRLFDPGEFEPKGLLALSGGEAVGLVHYLYHRSCWSTVNNCYLQDLYSDPSVRGAGVGSALIAAVHGAAAKVRVANVYWMTHETNETARRLYDRVAKRTGFIEYDMLP
ncbi:MAG: GNAT family N-acetyltransferase [Hyphomicrobiales bacterium]|nr:GNAT family N-acetyltransferase [Hyphomicrobiales bacterium]